jgi:acyl-CoA thioesterase
VGFDDDIALTKDGRGMIADGWNTPRGPLGGYVMAIALRALEQAIGDPARMSRSLTVHFLRPAAIGPVAAHAVVERAGRSLSTATVRLEQDEKLVALGLGAFSGAWPAPEVGVVPMPEVAPPAEPAAPPPGAPPFIRRMDLQPRFGGQPFTGSDDPEVGGWLALREDRRVDAAALCVFADAWYPAIWTRLDALHPAPTIDLTVHFRAALPVAGPLLARFRTRLAHEGFFEEDGELWTPDGTLIAQSRQLGLLLPPLPSAP